MKADSAEAKAKLNDAQRRDQRARQAAADKGEHRKVKILPKARPRVPASKHYKGH
jgi:hypothetical protein